ncbi:MAG: fatty acid desaturase [Rhodococcus sp. (in: high G+C Gram-positive bacteria)]
MAITDILEFAHLTDEDIESLGRELDAIRRDVEDTRGKKDAEYIRRTIALQRALEVGGRVAIMGSRWRSSALVGAGLLAVSKIIENMELGHNVSHGQWDWMNDPEIHSTSWEWDQTGPSAHWKRAHNYSHHTYTNIVGMDHDVGFGILRMTRDEKWKPMNLLQPFGNLILALTFEWGIALHDLDAAKLEAGVPATQIMSEPNKEFARKVASQVGKDFVLFPALSGPYWRRAIGANLTANVVRNLWAYAVIFCGHFPDGAEKFTMGQFETETHEEWYLRQMLGSANFTAGPTMAFMSGNLCYQIEHHLFPDLPSNRYAEVAERVRGLCDKYDLPYTTGNLAGQYWKALRTIFKLSLPDQWLRRTSDNAPETSSERRFHAAGSVVDRVRFDAVTGRKRGLRSALHEARHEARQVVNRAKATTA